MKCLYILINYLRKSKNGAGFTMVGLIVTVLVILVLSAATFIWLDPLAKIGRAKDERRRHDVGIVAQAISSYVKDHKGALPVLGNVTTDKKVLCEVQDTNSKSCAGDSQPCIQIVDADFYSDYLGGLPLDPDKTANTDTGYYLQKDTDGQLIVGACTTYGSEAITKKPSVKVNCTAYAGGYCWYEADSDSKDCDTVCNDNNLVCVDNVVYGPDIDSHEEGFCALNKALGASCSVVCFPLPAGDYTPMNATSGTVCAYRTLASNCDDNTIAANNICPCE